VLTPFQLFTQQRQEHDAGAAQVAAVGTWQQHLQEAAEVSSAEALE
jgi:hypothetical protein